jgi:DNA-binding response OmpR family regulator
MLAGLRILLLEDEYLIAMDVELLCRDNGAADVMVKSSIDELEAPLGEFDVAIVDLMLGAHSTVPFAERLREAGKPFVFASGYAANDELLAGFPGIRVVGKPYAGNDLLEAVAAAAGRR